MYVYMTIMWLFLLVIRIPVILLGLITVALTIPRVKNPEQWELIRLPYWVHPWDNPRDGILGDRRLTYWNRGDQFPTLIKDSPWLKAYYWTAIRNPANNLSRFYPLFTCNLNKVQEHKVVLRKKYLTITKAVVNSIPYYGLVYDSPKWYIRMGHKVDEKYIGRDFSGDPQVGYKGFTFKVNKK